MQEINATIPLDSSFDHILFNLGSQGFAAIKVTYQGGGDDGSIDEVGLIKIGEIKFEDGKAEEIGDPELTPMEHNLRDLIENKVYDRILQSASDWYNNEGGGGILWISTLDRQYYGDHYYNVVSNYPEDYNREYDEDYQEEYEEIHEDLMGYIS